MHLLAYLFGLSYYILVPMTLAGPELGPVIQSLISDPGSMVTLNVPLVKMISAAAVGPKHLSALVSGAAVFFLANALQFWSHRLLSLLSRPKAKDEGPKYSLPRGGPFELITCPHYSAEILIYLGLALICWSIDLSRLIGSLMILTWVGVNLVLAASATQQWYKMEMEEELKKRIGLKRLIPFVW